MIKNRKCCAGLKMAECPLKELEREKIFWTILAILEVGIIILQGFFK